MKTLERRSTHILVLDGNPQSRFMLRTMLLQEKFGDVQSTGSVPVAFDFMRGTKVDVALVDSELGGPGGGLDFVNDIRDKSKSPDITLPTIMIVPAGDAGILRKAIEAGVNNFVVKPVSIKGLVSRIEKAVLNRGAFVSRDVLASLERRKRDDPRHGPERRQGKNSNYQQEEHRAGGERRMAGRRASELVAKSAPVVSAAKGGALKADPGASAQVASRPNSSPAGSPAPKPASKPVSQPIPRPPAQRKRMLRSAELEEEFVAPPAPSPVASPDKPRRAEELRSLVDDLPGDELKKAQGERLKEFSSELAPSSPEPEPAEEEEEKFNLPEVLDSHKIWLESNGKEGMKANFANQDLNGADLKGAVLANANLRKADLGDAIVSDARLEWSDAREAYFSGANLTGCDLHGAKLRHADFSLSKLDGADLRDADLAGANLKGATLGETDLTKSNLLSTDLKGADLSAVIGLTQSQFEKALLDSATKPPPGIRLPKFD